MQTIHGNMNRRRPTQLADPGRPSLMLDVVTPNGRCAADDVYSHGSLRCIQSSYIEMVRLGQDAAWQVTPSTQVCRCRTSGRLGIQVGQSMHAHCGTSPRHPVAVGPWQAQPLIRFRTDLCRPWEVRFFEPGVGKLIGPNRDTTRLALDLRRPPILPTQESLVTL